MKKLFGTIIAIPLAIFVLTVVIPFVCNFVGELVKIDNIDFGFSVWWECIIDAVAGVIAGFFVKSIFYTCSKQDKKVLENIISIIAGFGIAFVVHFFIKYWIIVICVSVIILIITITCCIIKIIKEKNKQKETNDGVLQHSSTNH